MYLCKYLRAEICTVVYILLYCTYSKTWPHYPILSHTITDYVPFTPSTHQKDTSSTASRPPKRLAENGGDQLINNQNDANEARYPRIFSAFAFALPMFLFRLRLPDLVCLLSLS